MDGGAAGNTTPRSQDAAAGSTTTDEEDLASIRVRTMYGLVEEIKCTEGPTEELTRVLYLTNMQASLFRADTVEKMMQAFEMPAPSLVIKLMDSLAYPVDFSTRGSELTAEERQEVYTHHTHNVIGHEHSFESRSEATKSTRKLINFFKEVLLPLAAETNALILCSALDSCALSSTLAQVMPLFAAKFEGRLPFTVLAIGAAVNFANAAVHDDSSLAAELSRKSKNWRKGMEKMKALEDAKDQEAADGGKERLALEKRWKIDVQRDLRNYVLIEGISGGPSALPLKTDKKALPVFQEEMLQALSSKLPTLCVRTGASNSSVPLSSNVQLANRDIPVLMLDSQPRPVSEIVIKSDDPKTRTQLVAEAIKNNEARHKKLWEMGKVQSYDQHDLAYFFDVLNDDGDAGTSAWVEEAKDEDANSSELTEEDSLLASLERSEKEGREGPGRAFTAEHLDEVVDHLIEMMAETHWRALPKAQQETLQSNGDFDPQEVYADRLEQIYNVYYDLFKSERVYGANLENLDAVKEVIDHIVKRDRLPRKNTLQGQQLLRNAWNTVDVVR